MQPAALLLFTFSCVRGFGRTLVRLYLYSASNENTHRNEGQSRSPSFKMLCPSCFLAHIVTREKLDWENTRNH